MLAELKWSGAALLRGDAVAGCCAERGVVRPPTDVAASLWPELFCLSCRLLVLMICTKYRKQGWSWYHLHDQMLSKQHTAASIKWG
jgi:hypothetical protein